MRDQTGDSLPTRHSPRSIILISEKRTGSTIFKDEISKHPLIRLIEYTEHNEHETQYWLKAACLLDMLACEFLQGSPIYDRDTARRKLIEFITSNVPDFDIPTDDEKLVFDGWSALCDRFGPVFFEKSPQHIQNWPALSLILHYAQNADHDIRIVGLVRNPLAMVYSAWSSWGSDPRSRQFIWLQSYQNLLRLRDALIPQQCLIVHYEDMAARPISVMEEVCRFAGLPYDEAVGSGIHPRSIEKWREDPMFTLQLDEQVKNVARKIGYTDEDLFNPRRSFSHLNPLNQLQSHWIRRKRLITNLMATSGWYPRAYTFFKKAGLWGIMQRVGRRLIS